MTEGADASGTVQAGRFGMRSAATRENRLRWFLGILSGGIILLLMAIQAQQWRQNTILRERAERSYETTSRLDAVLSFQQDVETGQRGYLLTGNADFLEPYLSAKARLGPAIHELDRDFVDSRGQQILRQIGLASNQKIAFSEQVIAMRRQGNAKAATALVASGRGRQIMDRLRRLIEELRQIERAELSSLQEARSSTRRWGQPFGLGLQLLLLMMLAGAYCVYLANIRRLELTTRATQDLSARQEAIFDAATDAMMVVDHEGRIETVNPSALRLFNRDKKEIVGHPVSSLFEGGELFLGGVNERRSVTRPEATIQQMKGLCLDRDPFEAEVSSSVVHLADRVVTLLLVRDSTERVRNERMKDQFVSTVSHELRTPLTSIRGALALLEHSAGKSLEDKARQLLSVAKLNSERLSLLIDDILDVEKLGSRELEFEMGSIDLRDLVKRADEGNRTFAADRGVRLVVSMPDEPLIVLGDESRLLQAVTNLLSNAAKFSPKDGLVRLTAEADDAIARISVADQGAGIPADFRPKLFERFSQARDGQQTSRAGTGLGLAITKSIVERHKGIIGYETATGQGTRFWIELPLAQGVEQ